jgi:murein DD-endopeptidase MepM/ murein hydrolase activator NlpD
MSPLSLIVGIMAITILMASLVISLVAFTPLREYIPGYGSVEERKQLLDLELKADSIENVLKDREQYMNSILKVLNDSLEKKTGRPVKDTTGKYKKLNIEPTKADREFRDQYEDNRNQVTAFSNPRLKGLSELVFFTPVKGIVIEPYNAAEEHFGIDVVTAQDEVIKTVLDGTIVFTGFSAQDGYVIQVQHSNNLTSIYKHCADILKKVGERIKSGDPLGVVGNTGERSKGPHLHFELWYNGIPINPQDCVGF